MSPTRQSKRSIHAHSARKGKAVEQLIAAYCVLGAAGDLNAWTGLIDDEGVDLVFQRRDSSRTLAIQVKSRFTTAKGLSEKQRFQSQVREITLRAREDLYMLFVVADPEALDIGPLWLIPSAEFKKKARLSSKGKRKFSASAKAGSNDQWAQYVITKRELPDKINSILKRLD